MQNTDTVQSRKKKWHFTVEKDFILDTRLSPMARMLYMLLTSYASEDSPMPFPGMKLMARVLDCTEDTVRKYRQELERKQWLEVEHRRDGHNKFIRNAYILLDGPEEHPTLYAESALGTNPTQNVGAMPKKPGMEKSRTGKKPDRLKPGNKSTQSEKSVPGQQDRHEVPKASRRSTVSPSAEPFAAASAEDAPSEQSGAAAPGTPAGDADAASKQPSPASKAQFLIQGYKRYGTAAGIPTAVTPRDRQALETFFEDNPEISSRHLLAIMIYAWTRTPQAGEDGTEPYWYCLNKSRRIGTCMKFLTEIQDELEWKGDEEWVEDVFQKAERRFFQRGVRVRS